MRPKSNLPFQLSKLQCLAGMKPTTAKDIAKNGVRHKKVENKAEVLKQIIELQQKRSNNKQHALTKKLRQAVKKGKTFEIQKVTRKLKTAREDGSDAKVPKFEQQLVLVKAISVDPLSSFVSAEAIVGRNPVTTLKSATDLTSYFGEDARQVDHSELRSLLLQLMNAKVVKEAIEDLTREMMRIRSQTKNVEKKLNEREQQQTSEQTQDEPHESPESKQEESPPMPAQPEQTQQTERKMSKPQTLTETTKPAKPPRDTEKRVEKPVERRVQQHVEPRDAKRQKSGVVPAAKPQREKSVIERKPLKSQHEARPPIQEKQKVRISAPIVRAPTIVDPTLHPSWVAKKQQTGLKAFQGKKIEFGSDDED